MGKNLDDKTNKSKKLKKIVPNNKNKIVSREQLKVIEIINLRNKKKKEYNEKY